MVEIIGIGALNMDRLYLVERIAEPGEEVRIDAVSAGILLRSITRVAVCQQSYSCVRTIPKCTVSAVIQEREPVRSHTRWWSH